MSADDNSRSQEQRDTFAQEIGEKARTRSLCCESN